MKIPSHERQEQWARDYLIPLAHLDFGTMFRHFVANRDRDFDRESLREKMARAGVFDSLDALETSGTSFENVMEDIRSKIEGAKMPNKSRSCDIVYTLGPERFSLGGAYQ